MNIKTAEFVSPKHPDKVCDILVDTLLDEYLKGDPQSRVALEAVGGHGQITVSGEVTSAAHVDIPQAVAALVGPGYGIRSFVSEQSRYIGAGVDAGGAGDQGIMTGYATRETESRMPLEYELARDICRQVYEKYPGDGKTQVTLADGRVRTVVASFENSRTPDLEKLVRSIVQADEYLINPAGEWPVGGFAADSGLSGRKIVIDNYGPEHGVGGGSFSGKDYTKVDRSGAYMARRIAVDYLEKFGADEVKVKLAYAIGRREPVMAVVDVDGKEMSISGYDLSPRGIYEFLGLGKVKWAETAAWGHFGRNFPWH
ncbi:methionine adenosyltransferase domain-containing protein [Patescibacteria group bacterium]|nr:methionine adenosyltransferase domain-containing protein [Patescibacteria group bacterium]